MRTGRQAGRQADMTKLIVTCRNLAKAAIIWLLRCNNFTVFVTLPSLFSDYGVIARRFSHVS
jgi:hypothetical protein